MSLLLDLHRQNPPHVLHVPELTVFIWALRAQAPAYPQPDNWAKAVHGPFGGDLGLIRCFISELIVSFL